MTTAVFAAGCFWGVQAAFDALPGVLETAVGYTGGQGDAPTYREVCTDTTCHAEAIEISYDPSRISYTDLLKAFFNLHDPTQKNRQGPDVGTQYRSAVFVATPEERAAAEQFIAAENTSGRHRKPIATTIEPLERFWPAEDYHQKYLKKRGLETCHV